MFALSGQRPARHRRRRRSDASKGPLQASLAPAVDARTRASDRRPTAEQRARERVGRAVGRRPPRAEGVARTHLGMGRGAASKVTVPWGMRVQARARSIEQGARSGKCAKARGGGGGDRGTLAAHTLHAQAHSATKTSLPPRAHFDTRFSAHQPCKESDQPIASPCFPDDETGIDKRGHRIVLAVRVGGGRG